jgi:two-component system, OmpR family, alkaline phosphatase synthesis response regulator PhoP
VTGMGQPKAETARRRESNGKRVLIVEDEPAMARLLKDSFLYEGYEVEVASDGLVGLQMATRRPSDLIVLDVMLPGMDGLTLCRELRQRDVRYPILMLTARNLERDKVTGLKTGADDYLTKPFSIAELLARAEAILRRMRPDQNLIFSFGEIWVDFGSFEARRNGEPLDLSPLEFEILRYLVENRGRVIRRSEMLHKIWGYDAETHTRTVDTHIANLRQKIGDDSSHPSYIVTVHGIGYRFKA